MGIQVAWLVWFVRLTSCAANANLFVIYLGRILAARHPDRSQARDSHAAASDFSQ